MRTLTVEKLSKILKNKKNLEEKLEIKITNKEKEIVIEGSPEDEFIAEKVIESLEFGFPFSVAMLIKGEDYVFEVIPIKNYTHRKNLKTIKARIIGANGKTLRTLCELTKCYFELKDNEVGIIGESECMHSTREGIILLIKGTKTANVYAYLESHHPEPIFDLGLKKKRKKVDLKSSKLNKKFAHFCSY